MAVIFELGMKNAKWKAVFVIIKQSPFFLTWLKYGFRVTTRVTVVVSISFCQGSFRRTFLMF